MSNWKNRFADNTASEANSPPRRPQGPSLQHPWRKLIANALATIQSLRSTNSPAAAAAVGGLKSASAPVTALVPVDTSKLVKKSLVKHQKSQKEILKLSETLNQYRTTDSQAFENWKQKSFTREHREMEMLSRELSEAVGELQALQEALSPQRKKIQSEEESNFTHQEHGSDDENFEDEDGFSDEGPDGADSSSEENVRYSLPEDHFMSHRAWAFMNMWMDTLEEELSTEELKSLGLGEIEGFVDLVLFTNPTPFLKKKERQHIAARVSGFLGKKISPFQGNSSAGSERSSLELDLEIRLQYRKLASWLHPDRIEKDQLTDTHRNLWHDLQDAWTRRDFEQLRQVEVMYIFHFDKEKRGLSLTDLEKIQHKQKQELKILKGELRTVRKNFDFGFAKADSKRKLEVARILRAQLSYEKSLMKQRLSSVKLYLRAAKDEIERRKNVPKKIIKKRGLARVPIK